jgi:hypothetical protein
MSTNPYPAIDITSMADTKNALHTYARLMGNWLKHCRAKRKHWWHASLRPSLNGLTTGVVYGAIDFEIELNMRESYLHVRTSAGQQFNEPLQGESVAQLQGKIEDFLVSCGLGEQSIPELPADIADTHYAAYSPAQAKQLADVLSSVTAAMTRLRADIREETSPIQLWPHHFDLSMLWLPGDKVPDQDSDNEEYADKQMNFGFTFGDEGIPESYFYITTYPIPGALPTMQLPAGTTWRTEGFSGAVLLYKRLIENNEDPQVYLLALWRTLLIAGREAI